MATISPSTPTASSKSTSEHTGGMTQMPPHTALIGACYVRASTPTDTVDTTIQRVEEYDRTGVIGALTVEV